MYNVSLYFKLSFKINGKNLKIIFILYLKYIEKLKKNHINIENFINFRRTRSRSNPGIFRYCDSQFVSENSFRKLHKKKNFVTGFEDLFNKPRWLIKLIQILPGNMTLNFGSMNLLMNYTCPLNIIVPRKLQFWLSDY